MKKQFLVSNLSTEYLKKASCALSIHTVERHVIRDPNIMVSMGHTPLHVVTYSETGMRAEDVAVLFGSENRVNLFLPIEIIALN
jgi:hypothetical protein